MSELGTNSIIGILSQGPMIINDWAITIEDIEGGHRLTARRGSDIQTMDVLNGIDAPVPDIQIADVEHGHDVTITVGENVQNFHVHDGIDAPVPEISVEAVEGGHKVTAAVGDTVKSFVVLNGKDGEGSTVEVDPTLSIEGMAADAKATGEAVKPIAAITETTTTNTITWDGVIGDRVTVQLENGEQLVHVSDETPDVSVFTEQGFAVKVFANGETVVESSTPEDIAGNEFIVIVEGNNCYSLVDHGVFVVLEDNYTSSEKGVTFPKKGVYFDHVVTSDIAYYFSSVSSPLLAVPTYKVKPEALPESVKVQPDYNQHDTAAPDYIKNRPFWPAYNPKIFDMELEFSEGQAMVQGGGDVKLTAPVNGKRYTFAIGENVYNGTAVFGNHEVFGTTVPGTAIVAEQDSDIMALYINVDTVEGWGFVSPGFADGSSANIVVIEGDNPYAELTADDAKYAMPFGSLTFNCMYEGDVSDLLFSLSQDVKVPFEIVAEVDGVEKVYTREDCTIGVDLWMYKCDGHNAVWFLNKNGEEQSSGVYKAGVYFATGDDSFKVKALRTNYPGIFAPNIPAKKLPVECLPDNVPGSYVVRLPADQTYTVDNGVLSVTVAESRDNFAELLYNGGSVQIDLNAMDLSGLGWGGPGNGIKIIPGLWGMYADRFIGTAAIATGEAAVFMTVRFVFQNGTWTPPTATD